MPLSAVIAGSFIPCYVTDRVHNRNHEYGRLDRDQIVPAPIPNVRVLRNERIFQIHPTTLILAGCTYAPPWSCSGI